MQKTVFAHILISIVFASKLNAAGLDELSKSAPGNLPKPTPKAPVGAGSPPAASPLTLPASAAPAPNTPKPQIKSPIPATDEGADDEKNATTPEPTGTEPKEAEATEEKKQTPKAVTRSDTSKALENRLSLGTSLGWSVLKPSKGTWKGLGASDIRIRWKSSPRADETIYITGGYSPYTGIWTVDNRDYDTTLHGIQVGTEYQSQTSASDGPNLKAGVELAYMLVYAKAQDGAVESSDVKGGKVNLGISGGIDWRLLSGKLKVGPFAKLQTLGFTIFHVGVSTEFVF